MVNLQAGEAEMGILFRMLSGVEFFSPLTVGQIEKVLPHIKLFGYDSGEAVFRQGEKGDAFYIIYTGSVSILVKKGFFSFAKTANRLTAGGFFGEIALISDEPRTATVRCEEPSQIFALVATDFQFILRENPAAAAEMARIAGRRKFDSSHLK